MKKTMKFNNHLRKGESTVDHRLANLLTEHEDFRKFIGLTCLCLYILRKNSVADFILKYIVLGSTLPSQKCCVIFYKYFGWLKM